MKTKKRKVEPRKYEHPVTLEMAKEWYRLFGINENVLSVTGARMFRFLLDEIERLKQK